VIKKHEHYTKSVSETITYQTISYDTRPAKVNYQNKVCKKTPSRIAFKPNEQDDENWPQRCTEVLHVLYKITKGITHKDVYSNVIAAKLGLDMETTMDCIEYLESKGFVTVRRPKPVGVDYLLIGITSIGVEKIEKSSLDIQPHKNESDLQLNAENKRSKLQQDIQIFISYAKEDCEKP